MTELERLRRRLAAVDAAIPDELVEVIAAMAGAMLTAQQRLAALDFGDAEPFCPARRLVDDAA